MPAMNNSTLGARLRQARKKADLDQNELGEAVGITGAAISAIELGKTEDLTLGRIKALAIETGVSPSWLAFGVGEIEITQSRGKAELDAALLEGIISVVLEVVASKGLKTSPERLSRFVVKRYKEEMEQGAGVNRGEIEKILAYFD